LCSESQAEEAEVDLDGLNGGFSAVHETVGIRIYACLQSIMKYHPSFDRVLLQVLLLLPPLVLFPSSFSSLFIQFNRLFFLICYVELYFLFLQGVKGRPTGSDCSSEK
jgi:hypothetical protein